MNSEENKGIAVNTAIIQSEPESISQIQDLIIMIRGRQVMLDRDLAALYGVETKVLNQSVKRNISRFPKDFMFQLTAEEALRSQIVTSKSQGKRGGTRYLPYAFTENGVAMLSSVLHSQTAIEVNIRIMRTFTAMRQLSITGSNLLQRIETIEYQQLKTEQRQDAADKRIDEVFKCLNTSAPQTQGIFYDGQIYDAYRFVSDLIRNAKQSIILIDNYVDDTVLTLLDKRTDRVPAVIYTKYISKQLQLDINKHNAQYPTITVRLFNKAHDRFLIIDESVYHIGASIKDLGKKWFGFTLMHDISTLEIVNRIKE